MKITLKNTIYPIMKEAAQFLGFLSLDIRVSENQ